MNDQQAQANKEAIGKIRGDLIRRLFAVAISIGFSVAVVQADWVKCGRLPNLHEMHQVLTVCVALIATVLSWDGYLLSIERKPLFDMPRFTIDVILVFSYLFLFATSEHDRFLTIILLWCFSLYVLWDVLTTILFRGEYVGALDERRSALIIYRDAFLQKEGANLGPAISLYWFFIIALLCFAAQGGMNHFAVCVVAMATLILYRKDKRTYVGWRRGFLLKNRLGMIGLLALGVIFSLAASSISPRV